MVYEPKYQWKQPGRIPLDAQQTGERIELLESKYGKITPQIVLSDAKKKASPLHDGFEWDDSIAAEQHRLDQARFILRQIVIVTSDEDDEEPTAIRAFVSVLDSSEEGKSVYMPIGTAMENADTRQQILEKAYKELQEWGNRYKAFKEFSGVRKAIVSIKHIVASEEAVTA